MSEDLLVFKEEEPKKERNNNPPWKILVVDDAEDVFLATELLLKNYTFQDRPLQLLHAPWEEDAKSRLKENPDIAVVLLDLYLEKENAGVTILKWLREEQKNFLTRIIIRTGLMQDALTEEMILNYEIDGYSRKDEFNKKRMVTTLMTSLRLHELLLKTK